MLPELRQNKNSNILKLKRGRKWDPTQFAIRWLGSFDVVIKDNKFCLFFCLFIWLVVSKRLQSFCRNVVTLSLWSGPCQPIIPAYLYSAAALSLALESRTTLGRRITSPLLSFLFGWILRRFAILPAFHPMYDSLSSRLLPAALPLMVISAQARQDNKESRNPEMLHTLIAFSVCSIASCGGAIAAFALSLHPPPCFKTLSTLPMAVVTKVCGCLVATYIGGSANLAEVAWDSGLAKDSQGLMACLAAADVLLMCFYFAGLTLIARWSSIGKDLTSLETTKTMQMTRQDLTLQFLSKASLKFSDALSLWCWFALQTDPDIF